MLNVCCLLWKPSMATWPDNINGGDLISCSTINIELVFPKDRVSTNNRLWV